MLHFVMVSLPSFLLGIFALVLLAVEALELNCRPFILNSLGLFKLCILSRSSSARNIGLGGTTPTFFEVVLTVFLPFPTDFEAVEAPLGS